MTARLCAGAPAEPGIFRAGKPDRVISHHGSDDRRDNGIDPVKAFRHVDDGTSHGNPCRSRGIAGSIKKDRTHVQITAGFVAAVTAHRGR